jgi:hypothetical protein
MREATRASFAVARGLLLVLRYSPGRIANLEGLTQK